MAHASPPTPYANAVYTCACAYGQKTELYVDDNVSERINCDKHKPRPQQATQTASDSYYCLYRGEGRRPLPRVRYSQNRTIFPTEPARPHFSGVATSKEEKQLAPLLGDVQTITMQILV